MEPHQEVEDRMPTMAESLFFLFKAFCFRTKRAIQNIGNAPKRFPISDSKSSASVIGESRSLLYPSQNPAEFALQAGKVHNLRTAAKHLNGIHIPAGETFSFWSQVPRPTRMHGFVNGRELREGCIIPNIGGGLCQLTNALYDAALKAGFEIIERHGHSRLVPGSMAEAGRDATIFWNYVDLRFRPKSDVQLEVLLGRGELVVHFRGEESGRETEATKSIPQGDVVESCETCGITDCFRHPSASGLTQTAKTAWLVDAFWPEYDQYVQSHRHEDDTLLVPLASSKWGNYGWNRSGFGRIRQAPFEVAKRSLISRRLASQGAARQKALLKMDQELAAKYAKMLPYDATHLVVSQNLLPWLWELGALGGRTYDVLMTRLPMAQLQSTLDEAAAKWPESTTLADFRADPQLLETESKALAEANLWITPHSEITKLAGSKALKLEWCLPKVEKASPGKMILFPASTLGRKGAYEIRDWIREENLPLRICGPILESSEFWKDVEIEQAPFSLDDVKAVILPSWVENQPRRLLHAAAAGVPVYASKQCGLEGVEGIVTIKDWSSLDSSNQSLSALQGEQ